jgi:hypothetical protein
MKRPEDVEALVKGAFSPEEGEFGPCAHLDDRLWKHTGAGLISRSKVD